MKQKSLKVKGNVVIELIRNGQVIEREEVHNDIVNAGKARVARLLTIGEAGDAFGYIAIGEGTTGVQATDTALESEVTRGIADSSGGEYEADYKAKFEKTFSFGSGESYAITEAGVFDSATASGSTMLDRFTFSAKNVDSDTTLKCVVTITVSSS